MKCNTCDFDKNCNMQIDGDYDGCANHTGQDNKEYTIRDIEKEADSTASCFSTDSQWQYIKVLTRKIVELTNRVQELEK